MPLVFDDSVPSPFDICIQVRDAAKSIAFYREVMSFEPFAEMEVARRRIYGLKLGSTVLRIVEEKEPLTKECPRIGAHDRAYGYFMMAICVKNAAEIVRECEEHGCEIETPFSPYPPDALEDVENSGYAYIRDPDHNMIELLQGQPWSPPGPMFEALSNR